MGKRGLTLIEVVAALGIMGIGIVGILALFPTGLKQSEQAANYTTGAILGEYVIEQVRLRQGEITPGSTTAAALTTLDWDNYTHGGTSHTFDATVNPPDGDAYGTGEKIVKQSSGSLTDTDMYSRYEVTLKFDKVLTVTSGGSVMPNNAFDLPSGGESLMQVTVTVRWPRATTEDQRARQNTMTFVTFIRP
ncbi:MAG: hypothetical protein JW889_02205 [Verrucomicrobia bacterium]|nr:hypothetical protein [Verrucomicrobiota bacterium]